MNEEHKEDKISNGASTEFGEVAISISCFVRKQ